MPFINHVIKRCHSDVIISVKFITVSVRGVGVYSNCADKWDF